MLLLNRSSCAAMLPILLFVALVIGTAVSAHAQESKKPDTSKKVVKPSIDVAARMRGVDEYANRVLKDWNCPGMAIGIVQSGKLVWSKGYGYRDWGKKLPMTPKTLFPIASNTKLFTAVACGMLVEEKKWEWDKPITQSVPTLRFENDILNTQLTLQDMLSHRTGVPRHDLVWYKTPFSRAELFDRMRYMKPTEPIRSGFMYNNLMYMAAGQAIEIKTGKTWEAFVKERIFDPLGMSQTTFSAVEMRKTPDHIVPYNEKADSSELIPFVDWYDNVALGPAGSIISNVEEMSHWLAALMDEGDYNGKNVLPKEVLEATMQPAVAFDNAAAIRKGRWDTLNSTYGMGRISAVYRGNYATWHGGDLNGCHSQVAYLPQQKVGVIVLVVGDHCRSLYNPLTLDLFDRLLGLPTTTLNRELREERDNQKQAGIEARKVATAELKAKKSTAGKPPHPLDEYVGEFTHPAYAPIRIAKTPDNAGLQMVAFSTAFPLSYETFDRFDTTFTEEWGKFILNLPTNAEGEVQTLVVELDLPEPVVFTRKADTVTPEQMRKLTGTYIGLDKIATTVRYTDADGLILSNVNTPKMKLTAYRGLRFRYGDSKTMFVEFVMTGDGTKAKELRYVVGDRIEVLSPQ